AEGNSGTTFAVFTLSLSSASSQTVSVQVTVASGTAIGTAQGGNDFNSVSQAIPVTFDPGTTTQPFTVAVLGDTTVEPDETFTVNLSNPVNATLGTAQGTGTIRNDDQGPSVGPNQCYVMQIYRDLLGREVDPVGLAGWGTALDQNVLNRFQVALGIEASPEFKLRQPNRLYQELLRRPIDPVGQTSWLAFLNGGGTLQQVQAAIIGSPEYFQVRAGNDFNRFLQAAYGDILDRALDPVGQQGWTGAHNAGLSNFQIALGILGSVESNTLEVTTLYRLFLRREPDPGGLNLFVNALNGGLPNETVAAV